MIAIRIRAGSGHGHTYRQTERTPSRTSAPIEWAYNHHYCAWMAGKHSERKGPDAGRCLRLGRTWYGDHDGLCRQEDQSRRCIKHPEHVVAISEGNGGSHASHSTAILLASLSSWSRPPAGTSPVQLTRGTATTVLRKTIFTSATSLFHEAQASTVLPSCRPEEFTLISLRVAQLNTPATCGCCHRPSSFLLPPSSFLLPPSLLLQVHEHDNLPGIRT